MFDTTQEGPDVNPARNGHDSAVQPSHFFVTWPPSPSVPPPAPVSAAPGTKPTPVFPHITAEEGLAAPGILTNIPDHPTLGGPLYVSGPIARDSRYLRVLTDPLFTRLYETYQVRATRLYLLLDAARHSAQILRETKHGFEKDLQARQQAAQAARKAFIAREARTRRAMTAATTTEQKALEQVKYEIAQAQALAMRAHCAPGVPRAPMNGSTTNGSTTVPAPVNPFAGADSTTRLSATTSPAPPLSAAGVTRPEEFTPGWIKACKAILGAACGLAWGLSNHYYTIQSLRKFEPASLAWMGWWMAAGVAGIHVLSDMLRGGWKYAGARRAEEAPARGLFHWWAMRHTFLLTLISALVIVIEGTTLRNGAVASPQVRDAGNWMYLVASLGMILPATLHPAFIYWPRGYAERTQELRAERATAAQAQEQAHLEKTIVASADAQTAFALDAHIGTLQERQQAIQMAIETIEAPFRNLIAYYTAEMDAPLTLSDEQKRTLRVLEENARADYARFDNQLREYEEQMEPLLRVPTRNRLTLCLVRSADGELPAVSSPPKLSWWPRLRAFVGRVWKRLAQRNQTPKETPEKAA